jgi:ribosomal protein L24
MKSVIVKVIPARNKVVVQGANLYTRHIKKMQGKPGEKVRLERPLDLAKIAILNEKGEVDRIGYSVTGSEKVRIFKKTKTLIADNSGKDVKAPKVGKSKTEKVVKKAKTETKKK